MSDRSYVAPGSGWQASRLACVSLRVALGIGWCLAGLSFVLFAGMAFRVAFLTSITIENAMDQSVEVTPVGTIGPKGTRSPLPVCQGRVNPLPAAKRGGFRLQPGEMAEITYDFDDINFSEIVVENAAGVIGQFVVDLTPTARQYHPPATKHFLIQQDKLVPVPRRVASAAVAAQQPFRPSILLSSILLSILFLPWPAVLLLSRLRKKFVSP